MKKGVLRCTDEVWKEYYNAEDECRRQWLDDVMTEAGEAARHAPQEYSMGRKTSSINIYIIKQ